jgi:dihydropteroate synthase
LNTATGPQPAADRDWATAAAVTAAVLGGAHIVRVHRVAEMVQVARVADALRSHALPSTGTTTDTSTELSIGMSTGTGTAK